MVRFGLGYASLLHRLASWKVLRIGFKKAPYRTVATRLRRGILRERGRVGACVPPIKRTENSPDPTRVPPSWVYVMPRKVAVVGSGIAGVSTAYHLRKFGPPNLDIELIEAEGRIGGHACTVRLEGKGLPADGLSVDCGFMVCNQLTYPNMMRFFEDLKIPLECTDMSFCVTGAEGTWSFSKSTGALARLAFQPRFWRLISEMRRFHREALQVLASPGGGAGQTIGEWLNEKQYDESLVDGWILPFCAAVWSSPLSAAREMGLRPLLVFLRNHGFLSFSQPQWFTPKDRCGGVYLPRVSEWFKQNHVSVRTSTPVTDARRLSDGRVVLFTSTAQAGGDDNDARDDSSRRALGQYDDVVFATPAGALNPLLRKLQPDWRFLDGFRTHRSRVFVHSDASVMPRQKHWWASWTVSQGQTLTYWLNNLQNFDGVDVFETLNPKHELKNVLHSRTMSHPVMDGKTVRSQCAYASATGAGGRERADKGRVWLAGAYLHHGFHEDGFRSGIEAARGVLGSRAVPLLPVPFAKIHPKHFIFSGTTTHFRQSPLRRAFTYPLRLDYVDIDGSPKYWWGGLRREDHFGDPAVPLGLAVRRRVCAETGVFPDGAIDLLASVSAYGYCFNPIALFFVWDSPERGCIEFVVSEVTNTPWGQKTVHVLDLRQEAGQRPKYRSGIQSFGTCYPRILRTKSLHVSPFNPVPDGKQIWEYSFSKLPPGGRIAVAVTLYKDAQDLKSKSPVLIASMNLNLSASQAPWIPPPSSLLMQLRIHWQAVRILAAGLPFVPNTTCPAGGSSPRFLPILVLFLALIMLLSVVWNGFRGALAAGTALWLFGALFLRSHVHGESKGVAKASAGRKNVAASPAAEPTKGRLRKRAHDHSPSEREIKTRD